MLSSAQVGPPNTKIAIHVALKLRNYAAASGLAAPGVDAADVEDVAWALVVKLEV